MLLGRQTWLFNQKPKIISTGTVGGPIESEGKLADDFDLLHKDLFMKQPSFEQAEQQLIEDACKIAIQKQKMRFEDVNFFLSGDLVNQMTPTNFAARNNKIPFLGISNACATSTGALALASYFVDTNGADFVLTGTGSHHGAVEKQFRYPTDYGAQKPPTSQWTVTGAGVGLVSKIGTGPEITSATIGKVVDLNQSDPLNMGAAMAPAAVDTISTHLAERAVDVNYYDLIVTGDLGEIGNSIALEMLQDQGIQINENKFKDCGLMLYKSNQEVFAGGSGAGCSAVVTYGHLWKKMNNKQLNKILIVATGALLSPLSASQNQSIPTIAHAVSIENGGV
ncbi:stage V sporulation protein AD [Natronobacillus azotifigens]|uniref:Stage V sporulation protein AD n=1 Tax=Natronobacillus azotifigens TaxID=472978 RepID=A0A9J6REX0_9BACI|nr:stage V sporulation protein AD [Natronobacillus azotifigens]